MKIMGENQMGKLQWTQTIIIILLIQIEQIPTSEQKKKHSNETFHLGFYSLSSVFSYRKHISSKSNVSVLTISGKSKNIKIIDPHPILLSTPPFYGIVSIFPEGHFIMTPLFLRYFSGTPTSAYLTPPPHLISTGEYQVYYVKNEWSSFQISNFHSKNFFEVNTEDLAWLMKSVQK